MINSYLIIRLKTICNKKYFVEHCLCFIKVKAKTNYNRSHPTTKTEREFIFKIPHLPPVLVFAPIHHIHLVLWIGVRQQSLLWPTVSPPVVIPWEWELFGDSCSPILMMMCVVCFQANQEPPLKHHSCACPFSTFSDFGPINVCLVDMYFRVF